MCVCVKNRRADSLLSLFRSPWILHRSIGVGRCDPHLPAILSQSSFDNAQEDYLIQKGKRGACLLIAVARKLNDRSYGRKAGDVIKKLKVGHTACARTAVER